jgi:hypothetical protein
MANACPECSAILDALDINIAEGVALCPSCGVLTRLSQLVAALPPLDPAAPPPRGCSLTTEGLDTMLTATCTSKRGAVGFFLFAAFWNSIVGIFVITALGGLYANLVGPLPSWVPKMANSNANGGPPMDLGMSIFMALFMVPFVLVGLLVIWLFLVALAGVVRVTIRTGTARIFSGIGRVGRTTHVELSSIAAVRIHEKLKPSDEGEGSYEISLEGPASPIRFGSMLTRERRNWLATALQQQLRSAS